MPHSMPPVEQRSRSDWSPSIPADALTLHAWRPGSAWLRSRTSSAGIDQNALIAGAGLAGVTAFLLLWSGHFGLGLVVAVVFLITALAIERSRVAAWGLAIVPLFWWWAWSHGLAASGRPLAPVYGLMVLWAAVGGGAADVVINLIFRKRFGGLAIEDWRSFDSRFALVAAGPSINLALLALGFIVGRREAGLVVVAWWSIATAIVHTVRLAQAGEQKTRGKAVAPWRQK